jgi:hypothetical protein
MASVEQVRQLHDIHLHWKVKRPGAPCTSAPQVSVGTCLGASMVWHRGRHAPELHQHMRRAESMPNARHILLAVDESEVAYRAVT